MKKTKQVFLYTEYIANFGTFRWEQTSIFLKSFALHIIIITLTYTLILLYMFPEVARQKHRHNIWNNRPGVDSNQILLDKQNLRCFLPLLQNRCCLKNKKQRVGYIIFLSA